MEEEKSLSASLFSLSPVSFKMNINSPQATDIRADVSRKLGEFLGDYIDEVLTEYIVVLVCNGKHQNQARDDLQAFLGDNSDEFITWLWHHLSKRMHLLRPDSMSPVVKADHISLNFSDTDSKGYTNGRTPSLQKDSKYGASTLSSNPNSLSSIDPLVDLQCQNPDLQVPFEVDVEKPHPHPYTLQGMSDSACIHQNEAQKIKYPSEFLVVNHQNKVGVQFENHQNKVTKSILTKERHHLSNKRFPVSRITCSVITEDPCSKSSTTVDNKTSMRNPSSKSVDALPYHDNHSRGSVWDRLGKPCEDNDTYIGDEEKTVGSVGNIFVQHRMVQSVLGHKPIRSLVGENASLLKNTNRSVSNDHNGVTNSVNAGNTPKRKNEFNDLGHRYNSESSSGHRENHFQDKQKSQKLLERSSINRSVQPLPVKRSDLHETRTLNPKISKHDHLNYTAENTNHVPKKNEILDVKLKLQQVEMEMLKLRAKQAELSNDAKPLPTSPSTKGVHNTLEDVESRTVIVKNVHFAATKEALSLHFTKCGSVVNVVLITDTLTGQPKGSAYIVFATKDSVEKAVSLSGTSFFSRLLKVMRKADDMPVGASLDTNQPSGKKQPPQPSRMKPHLQRQQYPASLQWRREAQKKLTE